MQSFPKFYAIICSCFFILFLSNRIVAQLPAAPIILEVEEDDRVATIYWNSKTNTYRMEYDPDKQNGIYSYLIEWGTVQEGFVHSSVTPYRVHQIQPLVPGVQYQARVFNLDKYGNKSDASSIVTFEHNSARVDSMRVRLNGFFDDMNYPMGAFPEKDWNQSYSGCMRLGRVSQHINNQYHGHNVLASGHCDRGVASSRVRHPFDFTNRTGTIEFDLDGAQKTREFWYLDLTPFGRKRDLTGHISLDTGTPDPADPPHLLRILAKGSTVSVALANDQGLLRSLPNQYRNGACGSSMNYCPGENLTPAINVRRHWRIELSKSQIQIYINDILIVDASLITTETPNGLAFEVAQLNWILFSYNTTKENFVMSMIHWDNFGFDAPVGYQQQTTIHNYTDGKLGTETPRNGNERSIGMISSPTIAGTSTIPIPDQILDLSGNIPMSSELMFTIQGGQYDWSPDDSILVNGHHYSFPQPSSEIPGLPQYVLIGTFKPYSAILDLDPNHLITGNNIVEFYLDYPRLLNIHIELVYPINDAPTYSPPKIIFPDYEIKLMEFSIVASLIGPGIVFSEIDGYALYQNEFSKVNNPTPYIDRWYVKATPVSDTVLLEVIGNSGAQMAATGKVKGIAYYNILMDSVVIETIQTDLERPVALFRDYIPLDTRQFTNGLHQLFVQAFDVAGNPSHFDAFQAHASPGEYMPIIIDIQNANSGVDVDAQLDGITLYPNPNTGYFQVVGNLTNYDITILDAQGVIYQDLTTTNSSLLIDINDLPNGLYFVKIQDKSNNQLSLQKIIKTQ